MIRTGYLILFLGPLTFLSAPFVAMGEDAPLPNLTAAHGGPVLIGATPDQMVMGKDWISSVEAVLPVGARVVGLFVAHGKLKDIEFPSKTRVRARYVAPKSYVPLVDVIALLTDIDGEEMWSYCTISLYGQGEAKVKTSGGSKAVITIGDRVFGPVVADKKGRANIRVEVPPGVQYGYDAHGRPVDLHIPKMPRTAVFASRAEIQMGQKDEISIFVVVINPDGSINETASPTIIADRGLIRDVRHLGRGAFEARFYPPLAGEGLIRIEAFVSRDDYPPSVLAVNLVSQLGSLSDDAEREESDATAPSYRIPIYWSIKLGYALEPPSTSGFHIGTDVGVLFALFGQEFIAGLGLGLATTSTKSRLVKGIEYLDAEMTTWVLPVALEIGWKKKLNKRAELVVLGQVGMVHIVNNAGADVDGGELQLHDSGIQGLLGLGACVEWLVGPGSILSGFRYDWFPGSFERFDGVYSALYLDVGYRFWFR